MAHKRPPALSTMAQGTQREGGTRAGRPPDTLFSIRRELAIDQGNETKREDKTNETNTFTSALIVFSPPPQSPHPRCDTELDRHRPGQHAHTHTQQTLKTRPRSRFRYIHTHTNRDVHTYKEGRKQRVGTRAIRFRIHNVPTHQFSQMTDQKPLSQLPDRQGHHQKTRQQEH